MSTPASDIQFALALADRMRAAHSEFREEFRSTLDCAWEQFRLSCPSCQRCAQSLCPQVGVATGRGFVRSRETKDNLTPFSEYVDSLYLSDLHHASACLDWISWDVPESQSDPAAVAGLQVIAQSRIRPALLNRFRHNQCVDDAAGELSGHVLLPGQDGAPRLTAYDGRSELVTWLTSIAFRMVLTCLRKQRRQSDGETEAAEARQLNRSHPSPEAVHALPFIRRFYPHLVELVNGIQHPERRKWLEDKGDLPAREKDKFRQGLTDRQKIVFRMLYFRGIRASEAAEILGVSKAYISQCIRRYRERLAILAEGVIDELADEADIDRKVVIDELEKLFHFLASTEWDRTWQEVSGRDRQLLTFLQTLRNRHESLTAGELRKPDNPGHSEAN